MRLYQCVCVLLLSVWLSGCAMVSLEKQDTLDYIAHKRADVLTQGSLSASSVEVLSVVGVSVRDCEADLLACIDKVNQLAMNEEVPDVSFAALSELWLYHAKQLSKQKVLGEAYQDALLESARYAYAYLFFGTHQLNQRVLESRQMQVVEYYNYAVQSFIGFNFKRHSPEEVEEATRHGSMQLGKWLVRSDIQNANFPRGVTRPDDIVAAADLKFNGVRNVYQRDGVGADLVAIFDQPSLEESERHFSETNTSPLTAIVHFEGKNLEAVLQSQNLLMQFFDPFTTKNITINRSKVPLSANFTAPYGVWLAESGFAEQSLRTLFGREGGIDRPHMFMMQHYDPKKRVILLIHGLASSPEAWVNVANDIMGDARLRDQYQLWQVYYPTNMPIALNHVMIRRIINETFHSFDPQGQDMASQDMVVIGHSMGGVISRMLMSSDNGALDAWFKESLEIDSIPERLVPVVRFEPMPQIGRVVFVAAPHYGTHMAGGRLGKMISGVVRFPFRTLQTLERNLEDAFEGNRRQLTRLQQDGILVPNSIDNLDEKNRFVIANRNLRMSTQIPYHSIIAKRQEKLALEDSSDGVVPYVSAHLKGAQSEKIIASGHSVQENPQAILEIRRILHEDLKAHGR